MATKQPFDGRLMLTIEDVAHTLSMPVQTVRNQLSRGVFPLRPKKIGRGIRFRTKDLLRLINEP